MSGVLEAFRGMDQFTLDCMTPGEERAFEEVRQQISDWALSLDYTIADDTSNHWDDYSFVDCYPAFASRFDEIPRYRVRTETASATGAIPSQTGVYVTKDDPNATLQFTWAGTHGRKLRGATTFNEIGVAALAAVGRSDLWLNDKKMFDFATSPKFIKLFRDGVIWSDVPHPALAAPCLEQNQTVDAGPRIVGGEEARHPALIFRRLDQTLADI
jgi:hypothetical protein